MVGSVNFVYFCKRDVSAVQGHPRSLILAPIESAYVRHSNLGHILHRFGDIAAFMCSWPLFHPNFWVFPLHQIAHVRVSPRTSLKLFGREIVFEVFQPMWSRYLNVINRRTDNLLSH